MKISNALYDDLLGIWKIVCPLCGTILASNTEEDALPEYMICKCDINGNKVAPFELFDRDGETWIRRNKYPRFIGRVDMGTKSDIEDIEILDDCVDEKKLSSVMRKAGIFLLNGANDGRKRVNR